jgi:uncharacterized protein YdeI (YjbR/CyaY-like superfamily)
MQKLASGVVHEIPKDLRSALIISDELCEKWNNLTPLGRNEWICWVISVKKSETRINHITRLCEDLKKGKRRPCCWPGCPHRSKSF